MPDDAPALVDQSSPEVDPQTAPAGLPDVVIVTYNSAALIGACLRSVMTAEDAQPNVIVVDNSPGEQTAEVIRRGWPDVALIRCPENLGFARAANRGAALTGADIVVFLNPDTVVAPGALTTLANFLRAHPAVGIAGPRVWNDRERTSIQLSCRSFPSFRTALFNRYSLATRLFPSNPWSRNYLLSDWDHGTTREVDWVSGCCMAVHRSLFNDLGGFDETFWMYAEDVDLCYRARRRGRTTAYVATAEMVHYIGASTVTNENRAIVERHRSLWRFYRKHYRLPHPLDDAVRAAIVLRCMVQLLQIARYRYLASRPSTTAQRASLPVTP